MKLIDIKCPNCSGELQIEDNREFAFCQYCGHKIMLCREKTDDDTVKKLANLKKLLQTHTASSPINSEVPAICDDILRLDPDDQEAWMYKGINTDDYDAKISCYMKGIEGLDESEYDGYYDVIVADFTIYFTSEHDGDWHPFALVDLDYKLFDAQPESSEKNRLVIEIADSLGDRIKKMEDHDQAVDSLESFATLVVVGTSVYAEILDHLEIYKGAIHEMKEMISNYKHFTFNSDVKFENKLTAEFFQASIDYFAKIVKAIDRKVRDKSEKELEEISDFWLENDTTELVFPLFEALKTSENTIGAGMIEKIKIGKEIDRAIALYVDSYMSCTVPNNG